MKVEAAQTAIDVLKEIVEEQSDQPTSVRMYFAGAACSGPSFGLALDDKKESDVSYEVSGIEFIMDAQESAQFGDMVIQDIGGGFRVIPDSMKDMQSGCSGCSGGCH
ncbi:Fe-S cluster assembly protein HesB [Peptostreptococcus equinus]|uniref:Fe-S cluster assembly protein HesB n=1 Tax=Peptostreptococcus equinus TaxID=3003601 RepID=A0ABY7JVS5_9FIRM|nr:Fe-S cluster assembly protein HesB [Peptostreptococcus sp. CBA3647]WAW15817.1 Fe-S cluster assembly protein HesB [Peptostreptococcus sp. CBA3647]